MTYHPLILADSGILFAYYSAQDRYHLSVRVFNLSSTGDEGCTNSFWSEVALFV